MEAGQENRFFSYRAVLVILLFLSFVGLYILKTSTLPAQEKCRLLKEIHSSLENEAEVLKRERQMLLQEIEALETDPFYIELYAREKLNMRGTGEEIVLPIDQKKQVVGKKKPAEQ